MLAYAAWIHLILNVPLRVSAALGPLGHLPPFKQVWTVAQAGNEHDGHMSLDATLANGTTCTVADNAPGWLDMQSRQLFWPPNYHRFVKYQTEVLISSSSGNPKAVAAWVDWHRRHWNETHDWAHRAVHMDAFIEYRVIPPIDFALEEDSQIPQQGRQLVYSWPERSL
jgi:hypothetical protein